MSLAVAFAGPVTADGGTLAIATGISPYASVTWTLTGHGALTPLSAAADGNGVAGARYSATGGTPAGAGDTVTVQVTTVPLGFIIA